MNYTEKIIEVEELCLDYPPNLACTRPIPQEITKNYTNEEEIFGVLLPLNQKNTDWTCNICDSVECNVRRLNKK